MCQCVRQSREVVIPKSKMVVYTIKVKEFVLPSVIHFVGIKNIHGYSLIFSNFF